MGVTFPRDLVFEAYMGRWVDVSALAEGRSLRQVDPVRVTWGSPNEQGRALAPPSTAEGVLNNQGGHWTPGNPMSDYYDYLQARNVPTRLSLRVQRDTFTRTLPSTWGTMDTGDTWTLSGSPFSVGSGVGSMGVTVAGSATLATSSDSFDDCQVAATCVVNVNNVTGGSIEPVNLVLRYQGSGPLAGEHYLLRVEVTSAEVLNVTIFHSTLNAISSTVVVPGLVDAVSAKQLRAKFQVEGQTLRGKVYKPGPSNDPDQFEPVGWHVACHHERLTSGFAGIRSGVAAGNTNVPVTFTYDDWDLRLLRHTGELTGLQPTWDATHRIKKAAFKLTDLTQRLGRPNRPTLSSAPRRYIPTTSPLAYWPCDDGELANAILPLVGTDPVAVVDPATSQGVASLNELAPWLGTGLTTVSGGNFSMTCPVKGSSTTSWGVDMMFRLTATAPNSTAEPHIVTTDSSIWQAYVDGAARTVAMKLNPSGGAQVTLGTSAVIQDIADGRAHHLRWRTAQNGANIDWFVYLDGALVVSGTRNTMTNTAMTQVRLFAVPQPCTFGHVAPFNGTGSDLPTMVAACRGFPDERALYRVIRLAFEEGVNLDYWGDPLLTRAMGPQYPRPFLDQVVECAEADGAFLYAARYTSGLVFRGRRSMCARPPDATLSYSAGQVAPPFGMAADDRPTANLVRAERVNGGVVFVEQLSGPMNTAEPGTNPDAVGRTPTDARVNVHTDAQLPDVGGWVRALGTVPEVRFPRFTVNLRATELTTGPDPTLPARQVLSLLPGDRLLVTGPGAADVYRDLDQVVRGGSEVLTNVRQHKVTVNTSPYEKYRAGVYGDGASRYDGAVTTLDAQLTSGTTGSRNVTTSSGPPWTNDATAFPMDVNIGGERVTLSNVTGTGASQAVVISARNVNGLPSAGGKTHPAGTRVRPWQPAYYA